MDRQLIVQSIRATGRSIPIDSHSNTHNLTHLANIYIFHIEFRASFPQFKKNTHIHKFIDMKLN